MTIIQLTFSLFFLSVSSSFNVTRLSTGDLFTNPTCLPTKCNSTYEANNGCGTWNSCCFCKCFERYTFRSDLGKCLGNDNDLHSGCDYRFDDGYYADSNLKLVSIQSGTDKEIGQIKILPDKASNKNLGTCSVNIDTSSSLVNGQWEAFGNYVGSRDFFALEGQTTSVYLKWGGNDVSLYEGSIIKLNITCSRAGESCLVFKVSGTKSWPDPSEGTTYSTALSTGSTGEVITDPSSETTGTTDVIIPGNGQNTPTTSDGENMGLGDKGARKNGNEDESDSDQVKTAAIGAGAAILFVLVLMFAVYNIVMRKRARRKTREPDDSEAATQPGFSSAVYQDTDQEPTRRSRNYTYEKPLEPIYDDLTDALGNPIYDGNNLRSPFLSSFKHDSEPGAPVESAPLQQKMLHREPSDKNGVNNYRPLPKTPDQITAEATEGGYMPLSHSADKTSPLHADNPVYVKPEPRPADKETGHNYAVLEKAKENCEEAVAGLPTVHDYAVLEKDKDADTEVMIPGHDYFVLEKMEDNEEPAVTSSAAGHDYSVLEKDEGKDVETANTALPSHDYAVLEKDNEAHNYEQLVLQEPSPYQSLV